MLFYQVWCSEYGCDQDLHKELSNHYVKMTNLDGWLQQFDYRATQSNTVTILQGILDALKLTVSKTTRDVEGIGNDLNVIKRFF